MEIALRRAVPAHVEIAVFIDGAAPGNGELLGQAGIETRFLHRYEIGRGLLKIQSRFADPVYSLRSALMGSFVRVKMGDRRK